MFGKSVISKLILTTILISEIFLKISPTAVFADDLKLYSAYAVLIDADTGNILYSRKCNEKAPMASTTKIMTLTIALEYCPDDFIATTSAYASTMPNVRLNVIKGQKFKINDLYYSLMLASHNDVAVIIAENVAYYYLCNLPVIPEKYDLSFIPAFDGDSSFIGKIDKNSSLTLVNIFTDLMNDKAIQLGLSDTNYVTPNGLDAENEFGPHSTTAYDLAVIMSYCIKNENFLKITQTNNYSFSDTDRKHSYSVTNANTLLNTYDGIISGKTGFTTAAGYCYVCAYKDNDKTLVAAILSCGWPPNRNYKWSDAKTLLNYGKNEFSTVHFDGATVNFTLPVSNGTKGDISACVSPQYSILLKKGIRPDIIYNLPEPLSAPLYKGQEIGTCIIKTDDEIISTQQIICENDVDKIDYLYCFQHILSKLLSIKIIFSQN